MQNIPEMQKSTSAHRQWNSLEQGGAGMCTIATSSSNYMKERKIILISKPYASAKFKNRIKLVARQILN